MGNGNASCKKSECKSHGTAHEAGGLTRGSSAAGGTGGREGRDLSRPRTSPQTSSKPNKPLVQPQQIVLGLRPQKERVLIDKTQFFKFPNLTKENKKISVN